jgi:hypothetical protein
MRGRISQKVPSELINYFRSRYEPVPSVQLSLQLSFWARTGAMPDILFICHFEFPCQLFTGGNLFGRHGGGARLQ